MDPSTASRSPFPLAVPETGGRGIIPLPVSTAAPATPGFIIHRMRSPPLPLAGAAYKVAFALRTVIILFLPGRKISVGQSFIINIARSAVTIQASPAKGRGTAKRWRGPRPK